MKLTGFLFHFLLSVVCLTTVYAEIKPDGVDYVLSDNGDGSYSAQVQIGEGVNVTEGYNLGHVGGVYVYQGAEVVDRNKIKDVSINMTGGHVATLASGNYRAQPVNGDVYIQITGGTVGSLYGGNYMNTAFNGAYADSAKIDSVNITIGGSAQVGSVTGGSLVGVDGGMYDSAYIDKYTTTGDVTITVEDAAQIGTLCGATYGCDKVDGNVNLHINGGTVDNAFGANAGSVTKDVNIHLTGGKVSTYIYGGDINLIGGTRTLYIGSEDTVYNGSTYYIYGLDSIVVAAGSSLDSTAGLDFTQVTQYNYTLSLDNLNEPLISTKTGTLYLNNTGFTLNLNALEPLADGRYILMEASAVQYWDKDKVTLNTQGFNASLDDVKWENNQLVLYVKSDNVPEPTTATLSLLALAGLATRRRRK